MKIKFIWPGKTKNVNLKALEDHYLKKINFYIPCEIIEIKEEKGIKEKFKEKIKEKESKRLEKYFKDNYIICLTENGEEMNSFEFAKFFEKLLKTLQNDIVFVVGGFAGLSNTLLNKANYLLSLSKMTFPHEISRVLILEQIFRAISILRGHKYAK